MLDIAKDIQSLTIVYFQNEPGQDQVVVVESDCLDRAFEVAMMMAVAVVVARHAAIVLARHEVVDERQIVALDIAIFVLPDLLTKHSDSSSAAKVGDLIDSLSQSAFCRHA